MEPQRLLPQTGVQRVQVPGPLAAKWSPSQTWCDSHSRGVEGHAGSPTRPGQTPLPDSSPSAGQQRREPRSRTSTTCPAARQGECPHYLYPSQLFLDISLPSLDFSLPYLDQNQSKRKRKEAQWPNSPETAGTKAPCQFCPWLPGRSPGALAGGRPPCQNMAGGCQGGRGKGGRPSLRRLAAFSERDSYGAGSLSHFSLNCSLFKHAYGMPGLIRQFITSSLSSSPLATKYSGVSFLLAASTVCKNTNM